MLQQKKETSDFKISQAKENFRQLMILNFLLAMRCIIQIDPIGVRDQHLDVFKFR